MIKRIIIRNTRAHSPRLNNKLTAICHVSRRTRTTCCSTLRTLLRFNAFCLTLAYYYNSPLHNVWIHYTECYTDHSYKRETTTNNYYRVLLLFTKAQQIKNKKDPTCPYPKNAVQNASLIRRQCAASTIVLTTLATWRRSDVCNLIKSKEREKVF